MSSMGVNNGTLDSKKYNGRLYWHVTWKAEKIAGEPGKSLITWTLTAKGRRYKGDSATWFATKRGATLKFTSGDTTYVEVNLSRLYPYDQRETGDPLVCYDGYQHVPSSDKIDGRVISNTFIYEHPVKAEDATLTVAFNGLGKIYSTGDYNSTETWTLYENLPYGAPGAPQGSSIKVDKEKPSVGDVVKLTWGDGSSGANNNVIETYEAQYKVGSGSWKTASSTGKSSELTILEDWRGKQISFQVRAVAKYCGLKSEYVTKNNIISINKFPKTPLVGVSTEKYQKVGETYTLPANGADVTFSLQRGENDPTEVKFYYSTTEGGKKTEIDGAEFTTKIRANSAYYFWSKLGNDFCQEFMEKKFVLNEAPKIGSQNPIQWDANGYLAIDVEANKDVIFKVYFQLLKQSGNRLHANVPVKSYDKYYLLVETKEKGQTFSQKASLPHFVYSKITGGKPLWSNESFHWQLKIEIDDGLEAEEWEFLKDGRDKSFYFSPPAAIGNSTGNLYNDHLALSVIPAAYDNADWRIFKNASLGDKGGTVEVDLNNGASAVTTFNTSKWAEGLEVDYIIFNKNDPELEFAVLLDKTYVKRKKYFPPAPSTYVYSVYHDDSHTFSFSKFSEFVSSSGIKMPDEGGLPSISLWRTDTPDRKISLTSTSNVDGSENYIYGASSADMYHVLFGNNNSGEGVIELQAGIVNIFGEIYKTPAFDLSVEVNRIAQLLPKALYSKPEEVDTDKFEWCSLDNWHYLKEGMPITCSFELGVYGWANITKDNIVFEIQTDGQPISLVNPQTTSVTLVSNVPEDYNVETITTYQITAELGTLPKILQQSKACFVANINLENKQERYNLANGRHFPDSKTGYAIASHYSPTISIISASFDQGADQLEMTWQIDDEGTKCDNETVFLMKNALNACFQFVNREGDLYCIDEDITLTEEKYTSTAQISTNASEPTLEGVEFFSAAPYLRTSVYASVKNTEDMPPDTENKFFETTYVANCLEWKFFYNDVPSIAYRPNCIGINTYFEGYNDYNSNQEESNAIIYICPTDINGNAEGMKKYIVLRGNNNNAIVDVTNGSLAEFIIDGGTW